MKALSVTAGFIGLILYILGMPASYMTPTGYYTDPPMPVWYGLLCFGLIMGGIIGWFISSVREK